MLQEQLIGEIKQIPNEKLTEIYGLIHSLGTNHGLIKSRQAGKLVRTGKQ
jgi:hypothetical protein